MAKELRDALYRARATMAEASRVCSDEVNLDVKSATGRVLVLQALDRQMQNGVEDADKALIEYEKTHIFHLWVCPRCGTYQLPDGNDEDGGPECSCGRWFGDPVSGDPAVEMDKVMVERMD